MLRAGRHCRQGLGRDLLPAEGARKYEWESEHG